MNTKKINAIHEFIMNCILMIEKTHSELFDMGYYISEIIQEESVITPSLSFRLHNDNSGVTIVYGIATLPLELNRPRISMILKRKDKKYEYTSFPSFLKQQGYELPSEMIANSVGEDHLLFLDLSITKLLEILLKDYEDLVLGKAWYGNVI